MKFRNKKTGEIVEFDAIMINAALVSAQNRKRLFWTNIKGVEQPEDKGILLKDVLEDEVDEKYFFNPKRVEYVLNRPKNFAVKINPDKTNTLRTNYGNASANETYVAPKRIGQIGKGGQGDRVYSPEGKSVNLSANGGGRGAKTGLYMIQKPRGNNKGGEVAKNGKTPALTTYSWQHNNHLKNGEVIRKLTPIECERLQCLPDSWTAKGINEKGDEVIISNTQRYKALGNAFNTDVVAHILKFINH